MADGCDRRRGGLLGVACGDALGATTEFEAQPRSDVDRVTEVVGGGAFGWRPGQPTDDMDQTLVVLRAYAAPGSGDGDQVVRAVAEGLVDWFEGDPADIGLTTRRALATLRRNGDPARSGDAAPDAQANGSLMRCLPTALVRADTTVRRREAAAISAITHASPVCVDACVAYVDLAAALVAGAAGDEAIAAAVGRPGATPEVDNVLARPPGRPLPFAAGGWVLTALDIAVWAMQQPRPAADLLLDVINMGGDSDTNGAIAGGLLGCRDGAAAWPDRWVERLETAAEVEHLLDALG